LKQFKEKYAYNQSNITINNSNELKFTGAYVSVNVYHQFCYMVLKPLHSKKQTCTRSTLS